MHFVISRTARLRQFISDELNSKAHSRRTAGPGNALIAFEHYLNSSNEFGEDPEF